MFQMSELDESTLLEVAEFITQDEQQNITLSSLFFKDSQPDSKADLADGSPMRCTMPAAATYKVLLFRDAPCKAPFDKSGGSRGATCKAPVGGGSRGATCATLGGSGDAPLKGVISFSDGGQILHCLKFTSETEKAEFCKFIAAEIPRGQVFCILGEKEGCELIASAVKKKRRQTRCYKLMHFDENAKKLLPPEKLRLVKCGIDQLNELVPLQKGYELDEVLIDKADFEETVSRLTLRKALREQIIYALFAEQQNFAVAKAGTNARGLNWYQLGGIYTVPRFRSHGFAAFLAQTLALKNAEMGKKTALFVKDVNIPAQKAYAKAGFVPDKPFEIIYY